MAGNGHPRWALHLPAMLIVICAPALALAALGQVSVGANEFTSIGALLRLLLRDGLWWAGILFVIGTGAALLIRLVVMRIRRRDGVDWERTVLIALWTGSLLASFGMFTVVGMFQTG